MAVRKRRWGRGRIGGVAAGVLALATVVLPLAPTVASSEAASSAAGPTASAGRPQTTQQVLRCLGGRRCPGGSAFTCVKVPVPLDHFNPSDHRTIDVEFAVLPATGARKGMFVTATGGPGYSGISVADSYTSLFQPPLTRAFDIVFFDQRGLALSGGLTCPQAAATYYETDARAQTPAEEQAVKAAARTFSASCVAEVGPKGAALFPYLGTDQAAEDVDTFRQIMHDDKLWLYGESYGTQLSQTYAAAHAQHLGGLVLDGTVDLTLDGTTFYAQQTRAFSDTLAATLRGCDRDRTCAPDLGGDGLAAYDGLAARLVRAPISFPFPLADGTTATRSFTFADLETTASGQVYSEGDRMLFERALGAASRGDVVPMARLLYPNLGIDPQTDAVVPDPTYSDAVFYGVECRDYSYFSGSPSQRADAYLRAGDAVEASVPRLATLFYGDLPCPFWPFGTKDAPRPAPLRAPGVPTLVLGATADPATPVGNGVSVFEHLDDAYLVTEHAGPHVIFGRGNACPDDLVTAFLVHGTRPSTRRSTCPGAIADDYVPLAPVRASAFRTAGEALVSAETELDYLPEYYYWDGVTPTGVGCPAGGTLALRANGALEHFDLTGCAFTAGFAMTGRGSYDLDRDRFELHVRVSDARPCRLDYVREGDRTIVGGRCDRWPVTASAPRPLGSRPASERRAVSP